MNEKPRDFRDPADIDDALDAIRVADRAKAREFYLTCLTTAYHQGRCDMYAEVINRLLGSRK
jgi:hypothetical protein